MKRLILLLMVSVQYLFVYGQDCATPKIDSADAVMQPYFGNNQFLLDLVDSIEGGGPEYRGASIAKFKIPVKAWKYRGTGVTQLSVSNENIERYINRVNKFYKDNNVSIVFYLKCDPVEVTNNTWYSGVNEGNYNTMFNENYEETTFNMHFIFNSADGFDRGRFPWKSNPYACYVSTDGTYFEFNAEVLIHEIGHGLGLLHTHENARGFNEPNAKATGCYQEWVSRSAKNYWYNGCIATDGKKKCEVNGDMLCDTDADPKLFDGTHYLVDKVGNECSFLATHPDLDYRKDNDGNEWLPEGNSNAIRNIMSYSNDCNTDLTTMQRGIMYYYVLHRRLIVNTLNNSPTFYSNEDLDSYENDNYWRTGSTFNTTNNQIHVNEDQEHTFHKSPTTAASSCDKDWIWFNVPQTRDYSIKTSLVSGTTSANTELKLYSINSSGALTFITSDDNSGGNGFSLIYRNLTSGNYALEVINKNPSVVSDYNIIVSDFCYDFVNGSYIISDQSLVCATNKVFTLQNHYPGSTIVWSQSSNVLAVSGQGTTSYTVKASSTSGNGWLKVTLSKSGCPDMVTPDETFWVGKPYLSSVTYDGIPAPITCSGLYQSFTPGDHVLAATASGATGNPTFILNSFGSPYVHGNANGNNYNFNVNSLHYNEIEFTISSTYSNACGSVTTCTYFTNLDALTSPFPNPSDDQLTLNLANDGALKNVSLYNSNQERILTKETREKEIIIETRPFPNGSYVLRVTMNGKVTAYNVRIKH